MWLANRIAPSCCSSTLTWYNYCWLCVQRAFNLPHRASYIVIKNSSGAYYVQRRTMIKDYCPGYLDPMAGGVVQYDESFEDNAAREAEEEMGVKGVPLTYIDTFYYEDQRTRVWGGLFECTYDGSLTLQAEEVDEVLEMSADEILQRRGEFTPDGIFAFEKYLESKSKK
ncbi:putative nudix hydrolase yfcd, partial [Globisporangium splendens]